MKQLSWLMVVGAACFGVQAYVIAGSHTSSSKSTKTPKKTTKAAIQATHPKGLTLTDNKGHKETHMKLWHRKRLDALCPKGHRAWTTLSPIHRLSGALGWVMLCIPSAQSVGTTKVIARATALFERAPKAPPQQGAVPPRRYLLSSGQQMPRLELRQLPRYHFASIVSHWGGKGKLTIIPTRQDSHGRYHGLKVKGSLQMSVPQGISGIARVGIKPGDVHRTVAFSGELRLIRTAALSKRRINLK